MINIFDLRKLGKCFLFLVFVLHSATEQDRKPWRPWEYCDEDLQSQFQGVIHPNEGAVLAPLPRPTFGLPPTLAPLPTPMPEPFFTLDPFPDCLAHYPYMNQFKRVEWYESIKIIKAQGYDASNDLYKVLLADLTNMQQREYRFDTERKKGGVPNANRVLRSVLLDRILAEKSSLLQDKKLNELRVILSAKQALLHNRRLAVFDRLLLEKEDMLTYEQDEQELADKIKQAKDAVKISILIRYNNCVAQEKAEVAKLADEGSNQSLLEHYKVLVDAEKAERKRVEAMRDTDRMKRKRLRENKTQSILQERSQAEESSVTIRSAGLPDVEIDQDGSPITSSAEKRKCVRAETGEVVGGEIDNTRKRNDTERLR